MATDLTGTPTSQGIGTYNTSADAPSGLGFNAAMAQIDALFAARTKALTATGDLLYASAANTPARLPVGSTGQVLTVAGGVPSWAAASGLSVATTVGGLPGSPAAGAQGLIRAGSTPFDFIGLVWDATYGHWVSPAFPVVSAQGSSLISNNTATVWFNLGLASQAGSSAVSISYGNMVTAGLSLQLRVTALLGHGAGTDSIGVILTPYALNGAAGTPNADAAIISSSGTLTMQDGGWLAAPTVTSNTFVTIVARGVGSVNNTFNFANLQVQGRWIA